MNEVFDGNYGNPNEAYYANLNAYNQICVDTVRQTSGNNSARWLLIPGWNTKRIMISAHYYSPWDFAGEESGTITQWGASATNPSKKSSWGQEDYLNSQLQAMYNIFVAQGYPVVIGEFGSIDKTAYDSSNNVYRTAFAKAVTAAAKKYGAVPIYWDNGYNDQHGFGLFNHTNNTVTQQGIINGNMLY